MIVLQELLKVPEDRPQTWEQLSSSVLDLILSQRSRDRKLTAIVLGPSDSGKSTLIRFLLRSMLKEKIGVTYIDLDIGQSTLALPTTISAVNLHPSLKLDTVLSPEPWEFVGSISPRGNLHTFIFACANLHSILLRRGYPSSDIRGKLILIDTTGYLSTQEALMLKYLKLKLFKPQLMIMIEPPMIPEYYKTIANLNLLHRFSRSLKMRVIRIPRSPYVKSRSRPERINYRYNKLVEYFRNSREYKLDTQEIPVLYLHFDGHIGDEEWRIAGIYKRHKFLGLGLAKRETLRVPFNLPDHELNLVVSSITLKKPNLEKHEGALAQEGDEGKGE